MVAERIPSGPGVPCGDVPSALRVPATAGQIGVALQLLWAAEMPLGGSLIPDSGPAVVAAVAAAAILSRAGAAAWALPAGFVTALAVGVLGAKLVVASRRVNQRLLRRAEAQVRAGDVAALTRAHAAALGVAALRGALVATVGGALGAGLGLLAAHVFRDTGTAARAAALASRWVLPAGLGVFAITAARRSPTAPLAFAAGVAAVWIAASIA